MSPSGKQFEIRSGDQRAVVVEVGAGVRAYEAGGHAVLDGYPEDEMASGGRGALLTPWPNRIRDGGYAFEGARYQLALTEPDKHHAIHGLGRWANWTCVEHSASSVRMALELHAQPGYPFILALEATYSLSAAGLRVETTARNVGARRAPYGLGHHPYLTVGTELVDAATLHVPASSYLELDERSIPTGRELPVDDTPFDFRRPRLIGELKLDTPYTGLDADATIRLTAGDRTVALWMDGSYRYAMVFSGDTVQPPSRRRQGLAVEPMTCAPDAFNNQLGVRTLDPGQSTASVWGLRVE